MTNDGLVMSFQRIFKVGQEGESVCYFKIGRCPHYTKKEDCEEELGSSDWGANLNVSLKVTIRRKLQIKGYLGEKLQVAVLLAQSRMISTLVP